MFTGIVEERGVVRASAPRLQIEAASVSADARTGDSISVDGVCLTVVDRAEGTLAFDVAPETVRRTTLGDLAEGNAVNLERPVTLATRLGGHLVQGHVDGVGEIASVVPEGDGVRMTVRVPEGLGRYLVEKGSVAVDGVSLTLAEVRPDGFAVALIPHTLEATGLGGKRPGDRVNLEMDLIAKYVERLMRRDR
ncbi:MAG TPA: riboflavin synthase [Actinomycetota bacterium]